MAVGLAIRQAVATPWARRMAIRQAGCGTGDAEGRGPPRGGQYGSPPQLFVEHQCPILGLKRDSRASRGEAFCGDQASERDNARH